jgi:superfamily II DNA or RNA helicase
MSIWDKISNTIELDNSYIETDSIINNGRYKKDSRIDFCGNDIILSRNGVSIDIYFIKDLNLDRKIIKKFTIMVPTLMGYSISVSNHTQEYSNGKYVFPRFGFIEYMEKTFKNYVFKNKIGLGKPPEVVFEWAGTFNNNQPIIADHIMKNYFNVEIAKLGKSGVILNLEAGQGKTYLATGLIEKIKRKTLIITHNKSILHQWVKILKESYPKNKIDYFYGNKKEFNGDITVGVINSLLLQPKEFFYKFGYVIFDEVHEYVSKTRKKIYSLCSATYMLGLSATPDERVDGLDKINLFNCGSILNASEIKGYSMENIDFKGSVQMIKYCAPSEYTELIMNEKLEVVSFSKMVSQMTRDPYRIHLIVKTIYALRQKNMQILVFADRRSYLEEIRIELERFHIISDILDTVEVKSKRLVGGCKPEEMEFAKKYSNVILSTFQYFGTGVSIPKLDAVVLCSPRKRKSKQFVGRIFRLGSDYNIERQIIDIVDWGSVLKSSWSLRKKYYKTMGYPITESKVDYKELEPEMIDMGILVEEDSDGNSIDVVDLNLTKLEQVADLDKTIQIDIEELELLTEYSSDE